GVAGGKRRGGAVVGDAVLLLGLRRRHLVVALVDHLLVDDVVNGVGAPGQRIDRAATRPAAAAPLVGEHDFGAVVFEGGRVPVGKAVIEHVVEPLRIARIADVHQDAV